MLIKALDTKTPASLCQGEIGAKVCKGQNIERIDMPNFFSVSDMKAFIDSMDQKGIKTENMGAINPDTVINTQTNVITKKVASMLGWDPSKSVQDNLQAIKPPPLDKEPILCSNDGYILDGHHRWAWAKVYNELLPARNAGAGGNVGAANFGPVWKINLNINDLLKLGNESPNAGKKTDLDDELQLGKEGSKYQVLKLGQGNPQWKGTKPQQGYIDNQNQYVENGQVRGTLTAKKDAEGKPVPGTYGIYPLQ